MSISEEGKKDNSSKFEQKKQHKKKPANLSNKGSRYMNKNQH